MTRFASFFERPLVGIATIIGSATTQQIGSFIEASKPFIGYVTTVAGAVAAVFIALLWIRKGIRTLIIDVRRRSITHDSSDKTNPPFKL